MRAVHIELGGADRALAFGLGAWAALEDQGYEVGELLAGVQTGAKRFTALRALIWAMCQHHEPPPSLPTVGGWIDGHNLPTVMEAVSRVLREAMPDGTGNPPTADAGTGGPSGASPMAPSG